MRSAVLIMASALVAACSQQAAGPAETSAPRLSVPATSTPTTTRAPATSVPVKPPTSGAPIAAVTAWVEAGAAANPDGFHSATRDGQATDLGGDVAFVTPSGINCMTDRRFDGALACLVDLTDPPPQPADVYGQWKGGWVDFPGAGLDVGSAHGDPGRFGNGQGAELPTGQALAFGDYRCRADTAAVVCVNYAHQSAARFSATGIEPFGCLRSVPPPSDIGERFAC
jgi:hypothetical protein